MQGFLISILLEKLLEVSQFSHFLLIFKYSPMSKVKWQFNPKFYPKSSYAASRRGKIEVVVCDKNIFLIILCKAHLSDIFFEDLHLVALFQSLAI